jgi:hypothetical protein
MSTVSKKGFEMTADCRPIYNFYNCCCDDKTAAGSGSKLSGFFIWPVDNALHPEPKSPQDPIFSGGIPILIDADKKGNVGLQPMHRKARLVELSVLRVYLVSRIDIPAAYTGTILLDLVVMDLFGTIRRTISAAPQDYRLLGEKIWTPISLTAAAPALEVDADEVVLARIAFSAPDLASPNNIRLQPAFSAIGEFL